MAANLTVEGVTYLLRENGIPEHVLQTLAGEPLLLNSEYSLYIAATLIVNFHTCIKLMV